MKPLLLKYALDRVGDDTTIYSYDQAEALNVVVGPSGKIPFIDCTEKEIAFATQTRVKGEGDDLTYSLLEMGTKTETARERDDHHHSLLELQTKTFTKTERDDESFTNYQ
jgi:hypothetical protein